MKGKGLYHQTKSYLHFGLSAAAIALGFLGFLSLVLSGCGQSNKAGDSTGMGKEAEDISWTHFNPPTPPKFTSEMLAHGKKVFEANCAACHGIEGNAKGMCSAFLLPHPRDFTKGVFRFKTTPGDQMPTDQDLFRTVSSGLHGTGMPPWRYILSEDDRWAVISYLKTFSSDFQKRSPGKPVKLESGPSPSSSLIANGKIIYEKGQCAKCHGDEGYGDGPSALTLVDSFGNAIAPRNFHKPQDFKRGHTLEDIALTVRTGNNGTPMPSYEDAFKPDEIWALAAYVQSLGSKSLAGGGSKASAFKGENLGHPDVVIKLVERSWHYDPDTIKVKQGQLVEVDFQPTDNGLGAGHGFAIDGYDKDTFINGAMVQRPKTLVFRADKPGKFTFYCATQCSTEKLHPNMKGTLIVEAQ
jgi:mono/diheme cytochrome c family protein